MAENDKGFIMPRIDDSKCINCGLCLKKCDFNNKKPQANNSFNAYSLIINDKDVLKRSTSGGAFSALTDVVLNNDGSVVGAVMDKDFSVRHIASSNRSDRDRMRGSKYVQSATFGIYTRVKNLLLDKRDVLFSGTPCQCAALNSFLGREYENLIIVDFLCHGVPNNRIFKDHIEYLNRYYKAQASGFSFREKIYGWDSYNSIVYLSNGQTKARLVNQVYYSFFQRNLSLRLSCFNCPYRSLHRPSDFTIADFWGIEKLIGKKNRDGVSLLLTHSDKANTMMSAIRDKCELVEYPFERVANRISTSPTKPNVRINDFWKAYNEKGYNEIARLFFNNSLNSNIRFEIRKIAKKMKLG